MKNLKEFKELIARYESITLEEIEEKAIYDNPSGRFMAKKTAKRITGFSNFTTCTLCIAVDENCLDCVYGEENGCIENENEYTYNNIAYALSPQALQLSFIARAERMREILKEKGVEV